MKKIAWTVVFVLLALAAYLSLWPVPIRAVSWKVPAVPGYTGGRVLGFDFDAAGRLIAADAVKGLLAIGPDRKVTVLTDKVDGDPIRYADAVVVALTGKVYFSDASGRFAPSQWGGTFEAAVLDILEQASTSRILEYEPAAGTDAVSGATTSLRAAAAWSPPGRPSPAAWRRA